jgi:hypothetical protein
MKNIDKIKLMNVEEMANIFRQKQCEECPYQPDWEECQEFECWVRGNNYVEWLESEATE